MAEKVLGIETSCDETAAAIVVDGREVLASRVHTQVDLHAAYGGVVPELASRDHLARVLPVIDDVLEQAGLALGDLDGIAVTSGPGLIGALLVGVQAAKSLSAASGIPLIGVNHLSGHIQAVRLEPDAPEPPFLALVVSGGHTSLYRVDGETPPTYRRIARTLDDAAGEAFDKTARLLGLPYPGGKAIDDHGKKGNPAAHKFPRGMRKKGVLDFSFSGLKTAARQHIEAHGVPTGTALDDLCASVQEAIVEPLVDKTLAAAEQEDLERIVVCGGVAANSRLRAWMTEAGQQAGCQVWVPRLAFCTDNAAMIAAVGTLHLRAGERADLTLNADPGWQIG